MRRKVSFRPKFPKSKQNPNSQRSKQMSYKQSKPNSSITKKRNPNSPNNKKRTRIISKSNKPFRLLLRANSFLPKISNNLSPNRIPG